MSTATRTAAEGEVRVLGEEILEKSI